MKKQLMIAGIASVTALSSLVLLGTASSVDAADTDTTLTSTTTNTSPGRKFSLTKRKENRNAKKQGDHMGKGAGMKGGMMGMHEGMMKGSEAMQAALKANDYNAFVTAWNAYEKKNPNATVPTQEQFNEMVTRYKKHEAVMAAIESNDYEAYVEAVKPTREEFAKIVEKHAEMKAKQASSKDAQ